MATIYLILIILFLICFIVRATQRPKNFPPGPRWLPIVGNSILLKKLSRQFGGQHVAFTKLTEEFQTKVLGLKLGGDYVIVASTYDTARQAMVNEEYQSRPDNCFTRLRCMGKLRGITCTDGKLWSEQRSFVVKHLRNLGFGKQIMEGMVRTELQSILTLLENHRTDLHLSSIFSPSVLNVIWTMTTGKQVLHDDPRLNQFIQLLAERSKGFDVAGGTMSQFPWLRFIIPEQIGYNFIIRINESLKAFFGETIQEHYDTWYEGREDDLIYSYMTEMKKNKGSDNTYTDDQLIIILLDLFVAGSTTTSSFIDFIFLQMLLNPDIQEKAFKSLEHNLTDTLTYADRIKVPYLEAIIMEIGRLYGVALIAGPRRVLRDTKLEGYNIPKDSTVLINLHSVHYDKEYWGDPEVFRPERFLDADGKVVYNERVLSFGLGKRRCLGDLLARQCIFMFFAGILQKYKICPIPNTELPSSKPLPGLSLSPQKYYVRLVPRI